MALSRRLCLGRLPFRPSSAHRRAFATPSSERVRVRCGSAGDISLDLFNAPRDSPDSSLVIYLPPTPSLADPPPPPEISLLPRFLRHRPVASIHYRWSSSPRLAPQHQHPSSPLPFLAWPTPAHDSAIAFAWLAENLAPAKGASRKIYLYGSHLGAGLAASLSLTEARADTAFSVGGFIGYNGIYNWTMFLPDHRINRRSARTAKSAALLEPNPLDVRMARLAEQMPDFFTEPSELFDPFASPSLFFHEPGLAVPPTFSMSAEMAAQVEALVSGEDGSEQLSSSAAPRKTHLVFPPRRSDLRIPHTLLLHDSLATVPPEPAGSRSGGSKRKSAVRRTTRTRAMHSFQAQAMELADFMRRSVRMIERREEGEAAESRESEAQRRVQVVDLGLAPRDADGSEAGEEAAVKWLSDRA